LIAAFLNDLEKNRSISPRSRNLRLTAIRSFFRYAAYEAPTHSDQIQRVLAIPSKRFNRVLIHFLSRDEVDALLAAPERDTWSGQRDHALLMVAGADGIASIRTDQPETRGCHVGYGSSCALHRQRTEGAMYAIDQANQGCIEKLVEGT